MNPNDSKIALFIEANAITDSFKIKEKITGKTVTMAQKKLK